ncbi:MAG: hypothetical protein EA387_03255 [Nitriliruptor sp.]|nr:MAG: hypothetical protein EA387_03255 [Nitriliruptor sp.]
MRSSRAASRIPAAHPSVRSRSSAAPAGSTSIPSACSNAATSDPSNARSSRRSSCRRSFSLSRPRASGGSERVDSTRRRFIGGRSRSSSRLCSAACSWSRWRSSRINHTSPSCCSTVEARSSRKPASTTSEGARRSGREDQSGDGSALRKAARIVDHNPATLSSRSSRAAQAVGTGSGTSAATSACRRVDLPEPAGAQRRVTSAGSSVSRVSSRGRGISAEVVAVGSAPVPMSPCDVSTGGSAPSTIVRPLRVIGRGPVGRAA